MRRARALGSAGPSPRLLLVVLAVLAALVAGCAPRPIPVTMPTPTDSPTSAAPEVTAAEECDNPTQSYDPLPAADMQSFRVMMDPAVIRIVARGELVVGVSADTPLLGSLNPTTGVFEGFDIDLAHYLAERMLGDPDKVRFVVVSAGERFSTLEAGNVDLLVRSTTITCGRWAIVGFSAEYLSAGQKVLLPRNQDGTPSNKSLGDLVGERVCAPRGTSSLEEIARHRGVIAVAAQTHTECLLDLQQGRVDAMNSDDVILAGLASLDPQVAVSTAPATVHEPYGVAFNADDVVLIRFTNRALIDYRASGRWRQSYDRWLAPSIGEPAPFTPVYGRD